MRASPMCTPYIHLYNVYLCIYTYIGTVYSQKLSYTHTHTNKRKYMYQEFKPESAWKYIYIPTYMRSLPSRNFSSNHSAFIFLWSRPLFEIILFILPACYYSCPLQECRPHCSRDLACLVHCCSSSTVNKFGMCMMNGHRCAQRTYAELSGCVHKLYIIDIGALLIPVSSFSVTDTRLGTLAA